MDTILAGTGSPFKVSWPGAYQAAATGHRQLSEDCAGEAATGSALRGIPRAN